MPLPERTPRGYAPSDEDAYEQPGVRGEIATLDPYPEESELFTGDPSGQAESRPFGTPPPPAAAEPLVFGGAAVEDGELDDAFAEAESDREEMFGADDVAQAALAAVPEEEDDDDLVEAHPRSFVDAVTASADAPFATETVATLLEQQGHADDADALRARMGGRPEAAPPTPRASESEPPLSLESEPSAPPAPDTSAPPETDTNTPPAPDTNAPRETGTITPPETPDASPRRSQATLERWLDNLRRDRS